MTADLDVVDLIEKDHREVERLFERLRTSPADRPLVLPVLRGLLIAHSRAEESEVYPVARDEAGEVDEVAHSQEDERRRSLAEAFTVERAKHLGDEPGEATREELVIRARNAGIPGAADMTKEELRRRLP